MHREVRDLRRLVVADDRHQRRHQHQRAIDVLGDPGAVRLRSLDQEPAEVRAAVRQDRDGLHHVEDDQRLVDVHLEMATRAADADCDVVRHHLGGDHGQCLGLGGIHLARHDRRARLVLRKDQLGETRTWTAGHQADVVADLVERHSQRAQRAGELHQRIVRALHRELVRRALERQPGDAGDLGGGGLGETRRRVDPGSHRGTAERELVDAGQRALQPLEVVGQHARVTRPLLAQCQWRRILQVGATDLHDVPPFVGLSGDRVVQRLHGREQPLPRVDGGGDVHGRGERVVGRLRHVGVVVRVNRCLAAQWRSRQLAAAVGYHLVHVHVELRATAGHPHVQREHAGMPAGQDLVAGLHDQAAGFVCEPSAGLVRDGRRLLQRRVGGDHLARHQVRADAEVLERALRLGAPQAVGRHQDFAEAV